MSFARTQSNNDNTDISNTQTCPPRGFSSAHKSEGPK